jgi:hypothetical protein
MKNKGDEPFQVIIHINMKCHKETPCVANLNKQKCHFFLYKTGEQEGEQVLLGGGRLVPVGGAMRFGKSVGL